MQMAVYVLKFGDLSVFKVCGLVGRTNKQDDAVTYKIPDSDKHKKETSRGGDVGFWYHYN